MASNLELHAIFALYYQRNLFPSPFLFLPLLPMANHLRDLLLTSSDLFLGYILLVISLATVWCRFLFSI